MSSTFPLLDQIFSGEPAPTGRPLTGGELKESGMESVLSHTPDAYRIAFVAEVSKLPKGRTFTVEDITAIVGRPPDGLHNAVGGLISRCSKQGLCGRTGKMIKATRPSLRNSELSEWRRN